MAHLGATLDGPAATGASSIFTSFSTLTPTATGGALAGADDVEATGAGGGVASAEMSGFGCTRFMNLRPMVPFESVRFGVAIVGVSGEGAGRSK